MPKYTNTRAFQLGDYWLSQRAGSPAWYRTWFDPAARQTRRASLGTADFDEAKQRLTDWFILEQQPKSEAPQSLMLAEVFARYYKHHGSQLKSSGAVQHALNHWLTHYGEASVADAAEAKAQDGFHAYLKDACGLSSASMKNIVAIGKSALNWAYKRGELASLPHFRNVQVGHQEPKGRPLEIDELRTLYETASEPHLRTFILFMLGTAARTSAVLDLRLRQIDLERGLIDLNPPGRTQTKKHRPVVRLPRQLRAYVETRMDEGPDAPIVIYKGTPVLSVRTAWRQLVKDSGLQGNVQTYSLRHTVARWLRMQGVSPWEVSAQLGHKSGDFTTTEIYAPFDPSYLSLSVGSIESLLVRVV